MTLPMQNDRESVADVLERAADMIEPEGKWTQGEYARDMLGGPIGDGRAPDAVCWCMVGAIEKVSGNLVGSEFANPIRKAINVDRVDHWNDAPGRTQAEVVAALREAAALARTERTS